MPANTYNCPRVVMTYMTDRVKFLLHRYRRGSTLKGTQWAIIAGNDALWSFRPAKIYVRSINTCLA